MKKNIIFIIFILGISSNAQNFKDALLFSNEDLQGTARFMGMGGAFGAVGGDLSALKINPAGSAIFATNQATFTLDYKHNHNNNLFRQNKTQTNSSDLDISQAGVMFVFKANNEDVPVKKITFGINYDRVSNLNDEFFAFGLNNNSIASYFVNQANGIPLDNLTPFTNESFFERYDGIGNEYGLSGQEAYLAYEAFVINSTNPNDLSNTTYEPNVFANNLNQQYAYGIDGNSGKVSFNSAIDIFNKLMLGININGYFIDYSRATSFDEQNGETNGVNRIVFDNLLNVRGSGISFDFGAIYKPINEVRIGVSYKTPTWMNIQEELFHEISTNSQDNGFVNANPEIFNIFPDYKFRTPSTFTGSLALILNKNLLISADFTSRNYTNMKFNSNGFQQANEEISTLMQTATELNFGGEYRIKNISLRAGYNYHESPFSSEVIATDINRFTFGLGYALGNTRFDISYVNTQQDRREQVIRSGLESPVSINANQHNITAGVSFAF
ncbi:OmpP1/FadL family transporter [Psychroflexus sp. ALD_RP9]|uniref:OmpP1/FadL family transporter n=1 Tax=Psychroflexus sp. ALD_RP9 TaxID=2777186 RepID=UPI001A8FEBF9|nr:outer membrane protein transport protein [Psychroflexus sp. ALD_RP9]QSS97350.1 outer membrane protein transport protein [Psychroflexus sp. ALD_RP9]